MTPESAHRPDKETSIRFLWQLAAFTLLYYLAARLGISLRFPGLRVTAIWPPAGITVAAFLLVGPRLWPGILIAELALNIGSATPLYGTIGFAVANILLGFVSVYLLRSVVQFRVAMDRLRDVVGFILGAAVAGSAAGAISGMMTRLVLKSDMSLTQFFHGLSTWWTADVLSILIITPILLTIASFRTPERSQPHPSRVEVIIAWGLLVFATAAVFFGPLHEPILIVPSIIWLAVRIGIRSTFVGVFLVSSAAIFDSMDSNGVFSEGVSSTDMVSLLIFLSIVAVVGYVLAALATERRRYVQDLIDANLTLESKVEERTRSLQHALDNVKTLHGLLPICSSCKKIRDDHGYWQAVEGYVAEHTNAEFSHGICPDCLARDYPEIHEKIRRGEGGDASGPDA